MTDSDEISKNPKTAIVTMVYNEPVFLPLWLKHYAAVAGESACYVVDHGSTDGSTSNLGQTNVVRIPRSPMHDEKRARFLSEFCSSLLEWYDTVIYTDVDEFIVADPARWDNLASFCANFTGTSINCIGFDIHHLPDVEAQLLPDTPILQQRRWARLTIAMCKPLLVKSRVDWRPGFHTSNHDMNFGDLILFHLHYFDKLTALNRLSKTRTMPWGDGLKDHYQRWPDEKLAGMFSGVAGLDKIKDCTFTKTDPYLEPTLNKVLDFWNTEPVKRHRFYFGQIAVPDRLYEIPSRFLNSLPALGTPEAKPLGESRKPDHNAAGEPHIEGDIKISSHLPSDTQIVSTGGKDFYFFTPDRNDHIQNHHIRGMFYERNVLDRLANTIPSGSTILDIGANVGNHTIYFAGVLGASKVFPFEPNPRVNQILRQNVSLNALVNVDLAFSDYALGRFPGTARLVVTDENNWGNGHISLPTAQGGPEQVAYEAVVQVRALDSFEFERLDFIKIDVEGQELEVIRGGLGLIARHRPVIFVEVNLSRASQLVKILKELDYDVIDYFSSYKRQLNYLLVPSG